MKKGYLAMRFSNILKNISYSLIANLFSLCVSVFMVSFVPKFLSINDYGIWQLFLFYYSYIGFFAFGLEDGIYLRYAGKNFNELDSKTMSGQYYIDLVFQVLISIAVTFYCGFFISDPAKRMALTCAIWLSPLAHLYGLSSIILQITNRIKNYAVMVFTERFVLFSVVCVLLYLGLNQFKYFYIAQCLSITTIAFIAAYYCRMFLVPRFYSLSETLCEAWRNIKVGIKLLCANISGMLMIGIVRYGISVGWNVATFGKVSLTLGISNFMMVFINALSVVFFPILKRMDETQRSDTYIKIRAWLSLMLYTALFGYYPLKLILTWWLPKYRDSLVYMTILFPMCFFESKMGLLINTYLKSMRKETLMFAINTGCVVLSAITTFFTVGCLKNLNLTVLSIVCISAIRCLIAEYLLQNMLQISLLKGMITDVVIAVIFIVSGWYLKLQIAFLVYGSVYLLFVLTNWKKYKNLIQIMRS